MKYILLISITIFNIGFLFGQKKQFENILDKVERNIDENYFTDSVFAVRHSEYIVNGSTEDFEKVVSIEYFPTPIWAIDSKFYNHKFNNNSSIFPLGITGYLVKAKFYKKDTLNNLGFTIPYRLGASSFFSHIDINDFHSSLTDFIRNNRKKRENAKDNTEINLLNKNKTYLSDNNHLESQKTQISIGYDHTGNGRINGNNSVLADSIPKTISISSPPIYTIVEDIYEYIVEDIIDNGIACYKLTKTSKTKSIYTDFERQRFEKELTNGEFRNYQEQYKNELKQLVEYWANGEIILSQSYIITRKNFAVLAFSSQKTQKNSQGQWIEVERITEKYQQGKNKKYQQTYYSRLLRNYKGGFHNMDNFLTLVVRTPLLEMPFSLDNAIKLPRKPDLTYEDFCERIDMLDKEMLLDWYNLKIDLNE